MQENSKQERQSNIELMRILGMLLVIANHYVSHGKALNIDNIGEVNTIMLYVATMWPRVAINCFVLITGYFCCSLTPKKIHLHLKNLVIDRWIYSIVISFIMLVFWGGGEDLTIGNILKSIFPTLFSKHNYITSYIILYFFIPFINEGIKKLSLETYRRFLVSGACVFSLLPTCLEWTNDIWKKTYVDNTYSYVFWMIYIYLIGAYLKKEKLNLPWKKIMPIMIIAFIFIGVFVERVYSLVPAGYFTRKQNSFIVLLVSICVFNFFLTLDIKYSKKINVLASSSFAVLLIHDDPFVRNILWNKVFSIINVSNVKWLPLHLVLSVSIIYIACVMCDKIYRRIKKCLILDKNRSI